MLNNSGPKTDPWGTPRFMVDQLLTSPEILTRCLRLLKHDAIILHALILNHISLSYATGCQWVTWIWHNHHYGHTVVLKNVIITQKWIFSLWLRPVSIGVRQKKYLSNERVSTDMTISLWLSIWQHSSPTAITNRQLPPVTQFIDAWQQNGKPSEIHF